MTYKLTSENYVIRVSDGAKIATTDTPEYPNTNPDYLAYREWLAEGNVPEAADPVVATPRESWTPLEFYERFTELEQLAIAGAAMTVPQVKVWYDKMLASQEVRLDDPRTLTGMAALVAAGLLTQPRYDELMTPEAAGS